MGFRARLSLLSSDISVPAMVRGDSPACKISPSMATAPARGVTIYPAIKVGLPVTAAGDGR